MTFMARILSGYQSFCHTTSEKDNSLFDTEGFVRTRPDSLNRYFEQRVLSPDHVRHVKFEQFMHKICGSKQELQTIDFDDDDDDDCISRESNSQLSLSRSSVKSIHDLTKNTIVVLPPSYETKDDALTVGKFVLDMDYIERLVQSLQNEEGLDSTEIEDNNDTDSLYRQFRILKLLRNKPEKDEQASDETFNDDAQCSAVMINHSLAIWFMLLPAYANEVFNRNLKTVPILNQK
ncbi:hypothetical protein ACOME3_006834 [Neoechinorhynchus agilis]